MADGGEGAGPPREDPMATAPPATAGADARMPGWRGPLLDGERADDRGTWIWNVELPLIAPFNWGDFSTLTAARDELIAQFAAVPAVQAITGVTPDITNRLRRAWMQELDAADDGQARAAGLVIRPRPGTETIRARALLLGDPGEGDLSQWALRRPMLARARDESFAPLDFAVVVSDVIYSAGQVLHYRDRFHGPLRELAAPVYAIPGNHDWDDGSLASFMHAFVGRTRDGTRTFPRRRDADSNDDPLPDWVIPASVAAELPSRVGPGNGLRRGIWRVDARGQSAGFERLAAMRGLREARLEAADVRYPHAQPAPYFAVDMAGVLLICIDQGFSNLAEMDAEQTAWLRATLAEAERSGTPVVLLVGKPFASGGRLINRQALAGGSDTLQDLVDAHRSVVAVIGGDVHNYQHYRTTAGLDLVVAGGSGAYMAGNVGVGQQLPLEGGLVHTLPPLLPGERDSLDYLAASLRAKLAQVPVGVGLAAVFSLLAASFCSLIGVLLTPDAMWDLIGGGVVLGVAVIGWRQWATAGAAVPRRVIGTGAWVASLVGLALLCVGALAVVADDHLVRLAAVMSLGVAVALIAGTLLPFGVLSQVFPLPTFAVGPAIAGTLGLTWLIVVAYPALAAAGVLSDGWALALLLAVGPSVLVILGYLRPAYQHARDRGGFTGWNWLLALGVAVWALALALLIAHVWFDWGAAISLVACALLGLLGCAVAILLRLWGANAVRDPRELANTGRAPAQAQPPPSAAGPAIALAALVVWAVLAARLAATDPRIAVNMGGALPLAILLSLTLGVLAFTMVRWAGPRLADSARFMDWLGRVHSFADVWSLLEASEPPLFKSFLELEVDREQRLIRVRCWGVSGYEADADHPVVVDTFEVPWTREAPGPRIPPD